jgi:hypothetical protein
VNLRLNALEKPASLGTETIYPVQDGARLRQQRIAGDGQLGPARRLTLEQGEAELRFKV